MRYYIKSKFFKIKEDFWVKNDREEECFFVDKEFFSWGLQFRVLEDNQVKYSVREKLLKFMPSYEMYDNNNQCIATVSQKISFFADKIEVSSSQGNFTINGDLWHYRYKITQNGRQVADIDKEFFSFTDNYYADIDYEDEAFMIALIVIIDNIIDKHNNNG